MALANAETSESRGHVGFRTAGQGALLILGKGLRQRALHLGGDARSGYTLSPADRADLASLLLGRSPLALAAH